MTDSLRAAYERSTVVTVVERVRRRLATAFARSWLASPIVPGPSSRDDRDSPDESTGVEDERVTPAEAAGAGALGADDSTTDHNSRSFVARKTESSVAASHGRAIQRSVTRAGRSSRLVGAATVLARYVTSSAVYRWFTAEPEPEVIVIDLRETRTVGPIFAILDRVIAFVTASLTTSRVARTGRSIADRVSARPIRVLGVCLLSALISSFLLLTVTDAITVPLAVVHGLLALVAAAGTRSNATLEDLRSSRAAALLSAILEPPEPPERVDDESLSESDRR
ncbi:hypothetical protein ACFQO4_05230 [Saliphagus sp. GCM10025334]